MNFTNCEFAAAIREILIALSVCFLLGLGACLPKQNSDLPTTTSETEPSTAPAIVDGPAPRIAGAAGTVFRSVFYKSQVGDDLGGYSFVSPTQPINWKIEGAANSNGATVEDVLAAAIARLEHLQTTPQASDRNARALWELNKALQIFREELP